ncbi:MAG: 3-carboxy-cis,cis-muconate cycloisomerase [Alphaproteobacteria bacterium]
MPVTPFDSAIYGGLLGDAEVAEAFSDTAQVRAMLNVEAALARVEARLGIIPEAAAAAIEQAIAGFAADTDRLGEATEVAGVPVAGLVQQIRARLGAEAAPFLHWGATSQDVVDTALVLRLRLVLDTLSGRLDRLIDLLAGLAETHRETVMAARTRAQQATPTTFGLEAAAWLAPLLRHRNRLAELKPRLMCVQLGGASGTLAALGAEGIEVMEALAEELGLAAPALPWHTQRDGMAEAAGWLSLVTGSLGKMGQDLVLLAQSEVGEVRDGGAGRGGSSTMPQKVNPIAAETLVALARLNAGLLANAHQAMIQEHERGGPGWMMEWATLPQMASCAGAALRHGANLLERLEVRADRMRLNIDASNGLLLAEAAAFALAAHMPRQQAEALVGEASREAETSRRHLIDVLADLVESPVDWARLKDVGNAVGLAPRLVDRLLGVGDRAQRRKRD